MRTTVCTLFEKEYHLGVAVLVNSLARAGYTGEVHVGFRGPLPPWARGAKQRDTTTWEMPVAGDLRVLFLHLDTDAHFTNFKPTFMLETLDRSQADAVLYCDPDVVVNTTWRYVEEWLTCGVALCDDVNSPMAENHPCRVGWRRFFEGSKHELRFRGERYANGGVVGIPCAHSRLLKVWIELLAAVTTTLGGAHIVGIEGRGQVADEYGFADCFRLTDQDTLNAALEVCPEIPVSFLGRQAMGFDAGTPFFPHSIGPVKPWNRSYLRDALDGKPPARVDKIFWNAVDSPLEPFSASHVTTMRWQIAFASALGRLVRRS